MLDNLISQITVNPYFQQLKTVIENIEGFHDHESVYDHCVKTAKIAQEQLAGNFITNPKAKQLFQTWMEEEISGIKRKEILVLVALLHDCGKILSYKENGEVHPINQQLPNGQTTCPGHEFWGGEIVVPAILKDIVLPENVKIYIADIVKIHGLANAYALEQKKEEYIISQLRGLHKEGVFNSYCDCYTASGFIPGKKFIEILFNQPEFYREREYAIV